MGPGVTSMVVRMLGFTPSSSLKASSKFGFNLGRVSLRRYAVPPNAGAAVRRLAN
jgi:hypothetical protein